MTTAEKLAEMIRQLDEEEKPISTDTTSATEYDDSSFLNC